MTPTLGNAPRDPVHWVNTRHRQSTGYRSCIRFDGLPVAIAGYAERILTGQPVILMALLPRVSPALSAEKGFYVFHTPACRSVQETRCSGEM